MRRMWLSAIVVAATTVAAAAAADPAPAPIALPAGPQTLTGDWFNLGPAIRSAGFDLRLEWSQFYQGMAKGSGDTKDWQYGGKWDARAQIDLSKLGLWDGLSFTVQGQWNYGESVNGFGGTLIPVNFALALPGIEDSDASDLMALYVTQNFGDLVSASVGRMNTVEFARATPLKGGGGVDTFWNNVVASPLSGLIPAQIDGARISLNTQPVSYSLMVYDAQGRTNVPLFSDMFENGVTVVPSATFHTTVAGRTGHYGIKGIYSTKEGRDFDELIVPPGTPVSTKKGSWYVGLSMQQYLVQDPTNPARGWGIFGEITKADGNPNYIEWNTFVGVGGTGLIPGRPDDRFGIAYFHFGYSRVLKDEVAPVFNLKDESGLEVFYNVAVTPWLRISADLQFISPGSGDSPRAIFVGLSSYVRF